MRSVLIPCAVALALAGCAEELEREMPTAPNMQPVVTAYVTPTAAFNKANAQTILDSLDAQFQLSERFCGRLANEAGTGEQSCAGIEQILGAVGAIGQGGSQGSPGGQGGTTGQLTAALNVGGTEVDGQGFFEVRRVCPGWGVNPPVDVGTNGGLMLTATMSETGLNPVVWGKLDDCRVEEQGRKLQVTGDFHLFLGNDDGTVSLSPDFVVLDITARVLIDGEVFEGRVDLKLRMTGRVEVRVPVVEEHVIFFHETRGNTYSTGFRATNGTWGCILEQRQCTNEAGDTIVW